MRVSKYTLEQIKNLEYKAKVYEILMRRFEGDLNNNDKALIIYELISDPENDKDKTGIIEEISKIMNM